MALMLLWCCSDASNTFNSCHVQWAVLAEQFDQWMKWILFDNTESAESAEWWLERELSIRFGRTRLADDARRAAEFLIWQTNFFPLQFSINLLKTNLNKSSWPTRVMTHRLIGARRTHRLAEVEINRPVCHLEFESFIRRFQRQTTAENRTDNRTDNKW